jgi:hypothetical protein
MTIKDYGTAELIDELYERGIFTNATYHKDILPRKGHTLKLIATLGEPPDTFECRECRCQLCSTQFRYYQSRVTSTGHLQRANALCKECARASNKQRQKVLKNATIPPRPESGAPCSHCNRSWSGKWHRHHMGEDFKGWLCGQCNMSLHDQRNKNAS